MQVVKIGGSVLYDNKGQVKKNIISSITSQLPKNTLVVIGCGETLHKLTYEYHLTDNPANKDEKLYPQRLKGFKEINKKIEENLEIFRKHSKIQLTVKTPLELFIKNSKGSKDTHEIEWYNKEMIQFNQASPLLTSGGLVLDKNLLFSTVSSDTIAAFLAKKQKSNSLILLSDVDGIYNNQEEVIRDFNPENLKKHFITGGMRKKIRRTKYAYNHGVETIVANGTNPERLKKIIDGEKTTYTTIRMSN